MMKEGISVIIPTYNRAELLNKTIRSLVYQDIDKTKYEIIIVDDGSSDNTQEVVESYTDSVNIKYLFQEDHGFQVAKARNLGIRHSSFNVTLFFDSGMLAEPRLLSRHFERHRTSSKQVLIGLAYGFEEFETTNLDSVGQIIDSNSIEDAIDIFSALESSHDCREQYFQSINFDCSRSRIPWILLWTCHVSCCSELLKDVEGFDEFFSSWGGEDVELGIRLDQAGGRFGVIPEAKAIHYPHYQDSTGRKESSLRNCQYIHAKHNLYASSLMSQGCDWREVIALNLEKITTEATHALEKSI